MSSTTGRCPARRWELHRTNIRAILITTSESAAPSCHFKVSGSEPSEEQGREGGPGAQPTGTGHVELRSHLTSKASQINPMATWPGFSQGFGHDLLRADPTAGQVCCYPHHTYIVFNPNAKRRGKQDVFCSRTSISTKIICVSGSTTIFGFI